MASDRTSAGSPAARGLSRSGKHFAAAAIVASLVFGVFLAYAFLARATYQATAQIAVEPVAAAPVTLPAPLEASRRLHEAVLGPEQMQRLAKELSPRGAVEVRMLRDALEMDTIDSRMFSVSFRDSDPERAQRLCSMLARQAVTVAPVVLAPRSEEERTGESEREQRLAALLAFLAKHPEVTAGEKGDASGAKPEDAGLSALRVERERLSRRLQGIGAGSDNPYTDPADVDLKPETIRRRIAEIDGVVASRQRAMAERRPDVAQVPPAMVDEWRRLVQALSDAPPPAERTAPVLKSRLVAEAALPRWPVEPNRKLILLIGLLASLGAFGIILVARGGSGRRSSAGPHTRRSAELSGVGPRPEPLASPLPPLPGTPPRGSSQPEGVNPPAAQTAQFDAKRAPSNATLAFGATSPVPIYSGENHGKAGSSAPPAGPEQAPDRTLALPREAPLGMDGSRTVGLGQASSSVDAAPLEARAVMPERPADTVTPAAGGFGPAAAQGVPPPRAPQPSILPHAVIEINAGHQRATQDPRRVEAVAEVTNELPREIREAREAPMPMRPPSRTTQVFGSPLQGLGSDPPPAAGRADVGARADRTSVAAEVVAGTGYRMSGSPAAHRQEPAPRDEPQPHARVSSGGYVYGSDARSSAVPPRVRVLVQDISGQFQPDPSLSHQSRSDLTAKVLSFGQGRCFVTGISGAHDAPEAKARLSAELALALSHQGRRTLLVEGDFQRPSVHRLLRASPSVSTGFSQQLHQRMRNQAQAYWSVVRCSPTLDVLPEGVMRSPGLMVSPQFIACIAELREYYEFILIDGPPLSAEAECRTLNSVAEGMIVVSSIASPEIVDRASQLFPEKPFSAIVAAA